MDSLENAKYHQFTHTCKPHSFQIEMGVLTIVLEHIALYVKPVPQQPSYIEGQNVENGNL